MLPGPGDMLTADPRLWAAQGLDVVTPSPAEIYRIAADQQAAAARLIAEAQADAPIWLVGPNPAVEAAMAAMPRSGAGQVSGVVVTSTTSGAGTCSERMTYSYSGSGAPPKVSVSRSGDGCPAGSPFGPGGNSRDCTGGHAESTTADRGLDAGGCRIERRGEAGRGFDQIGAAKLIGRRQSSSAKSAPGGQTGRGRELDSISRRRGGGA